MDPIYTVVNNKINANFVHKWWVLAINIWIQYFFEKKIIIVSIMKNQEQSSYNTEVSIAKLQRYQHHTRSITIQTLKTNPLTYD